VNTNQPDTKTQKNSNWLRNFAIGLVLFISGILAKFYPATILTVTYIVSGVILALIGICDIIAALKYKKTGSDWKLILIMGVLSIIAAVYFIPAVIYLYSINISIYVLAAWLITRGILNIAGKIRGTLKRKNVLLWAIVMIASGIVCAVFCEQIVAYSVSYLAYILIALGVLLAFFGIYQKTDEKETKEKALREEAVRNGLDSAVETAKHNQELLEQPKEVVPESAVNASESKPAAETEKETVEAIVSTDDVENDPDAIEVEAEEIIPAKESKTEKKGLFGSLFKK